MNRDEAKIILLLYRPGTADAGDPEVAEALTLAKNDPELTAPAHLPLRRYYEREGNLQFERLKTS